MVLEIIVATIAVIANCAIAFLVFVHNRRSATTRFFFYLSLAIIAWIVATFLSLHSATEVQKLFWTRAVMLTATAQALFFYLLVITFPDARLPLASNRYKFILGAGLLVAITALSPFLFTHLELQPNSSYSPIPGPGMALFLPYALGLVVSGLWVMIRKFRHSHGVKRNQLKLLLAGTGLMFILIIVFNLLLPLLANISSGVDFSPLFPVIFVGFTAYAIITQHLFDIRVIIRRTIIFAGLLTIVFGIYSAIIVLVTQLFQQNINTRESFFTNLFAALVIGFTFEPLRRWISDRTDQWLFKKEYEQQTVLKELGQKLNNVVGLDEALESVMQTVAKVLHLKHAVTYVFQPGENNTTAIKRVKQVGYSTAAKLILEDRDFTVQYFSQTPTICLTSDLRTELEQEEALIEQNKVEATFIRQHAIKQAVLKKLESMEVAAAVPLQLNNQPIGLLLLSDKLSGETFRTQDLALLELVGAQAISSIQKAKLFEGDQMKSEFVSIASHELLTPISAIEGYLSMILEENIGKVDPQARDYLNKVYTSAKRLSLLIKDLLSVSRIESGKMKIDAQQLDISKMINDTLDQLKFVAADKKLEMKFESTEKNLPPVWADPDRTMQVLVNLVSNAIKYTPKGNVTITAKSDKHLGIVTVTVADSGLGMDKDQMSHLFTKFYRVDTPQTTGIQGTGLGLYITKSIIEKMGGSITCKSVVGQGSTFSFTLPIFKVETSVVA